MGFKHVSVRVPWHDNKWDGTICKNPTENAACLVLENIRQEKDENALEDYKGQSLKEIPKDRWPPCVKERATIMADFPHTLKISHPYYNYSDKHKNLEKTDLRIPPYSAALVPFRWMHKDYVQEVADSKGLNYEPDNEPKFSGWESSWVNGPDNQRILLNAFAEEIEPDKSLCIFYAKDTPLADDPRRTIIGIGRVEHLADLKEYDVKNPNGFKSYIWERPMQHSVRKNFKDGFIFPYQEILEKAEKDHTINPNDYIAFAPDDRRMEFSYGSEHVTHDGAIAALLTCKERLEKIQKIVDGPWPRVIQWIDDRLSELWKLRGPYPGVGAVLKAFGIERGSLLAFEISKVLGENEDPWPLVDKLLKNPDEQSANLTQYISPINRRVWQNLKQKDPQRVEVLKLLSRFEISDDQAKRFYEESSRNNAGISASDEELITNPYLFYEQDRYSLEPISIWTVDRGLFPETTVREKHPLPEPSAISDGFDPRRVRALIIQQLDKMADNGHTLQSRDKVINEVSSMNLSTKCEITGDILNAIEEDFINEINITEFEDGTKAYQLNRYDELGKLIRETVERRIKGKRTNTDIDWREKLDEEFKDIDIPEEDRETEEKARKEKAAALKELYESRITVLLGAAGTGKTTLLKVLCNEPSIKNRGVALLAPTGKARVQMQKSTGIEAKTIAQFLLKINRYDGETGRYHRSSYDAEEVGKTVIIDEASMLTEDQLGAVLDGIKGYDRLILVGDPYQLPPIGAGRPFYDIVTYLQPDGIESSEYKIGRGYVELVVKRRQVQTGDNELLDLQLAEWFSDRPLGPGEDEIWGKLAKQDQLDRLRFEKWEDRDDFDSKFISVLTEELDLQNDQDFKGFGMSLGGTEYNGNTYFNRGAAEKVESWQILSPYKGMYYGVREINRLLQRQFRGDMIQFAREFNRIMDPVGGEEICYGDKVFNVNNHRRTNVYPKDDALKYIANGEIGIVTGQLVGRKSNWNGKPKFVNVEFSSQPGFEYHFTRGDFKDEGMPPLELAYALSVHKAQGSEFGLTVLILPRKELLLSRELLYTALTRQRDRVVIMHQMGLDEIRKFSGDRFSETKIRLTNLFQKPHLIQVDDALLDQHLIHKSSEGTLLRSKSEVIIANMLEAHSIDYEYEQKLIGTDGQQRFPDFTIEDSHAGITYYWEHCGMLTNPEYKRRWQRKLDWYKVQEILPIDEGGGAKGTLIVTEDKPDGGIEADSIQRLIEEFF